MKMKRGLFVMAFLSLTLPRGQDRARAQPPARDEEKATAPVNQDEKVIVPYKEDADPDASAEEFDVATRIDQLRLRVSSGDPHQRTVNQSKLRDAVEQQFDLRQARLGRALDALRRRVGELETLVSDSPARRDRAIARGLRRVVLEEELPGEEMHNRVIPPQAGAGRRSMRKEQAGTGAAPYERDVVLRVVQLSSQLKLGTADRGERAGIEKQLREALGEQFDLRQARFARALAALREEVQELDELVKKRREGRDRAIARRLRSLGVGRN
jgi:hypothetical protein